LEVIDIGIPPAVVTDVNPRQELIEPLMVRAALGDRPAESHKGSFGHLLVIAGSPGKTGAAVMTAGSALRIGTGLVTLGTAAAIQHILAAQVAEAMTQSLPDDGEGILGGTAAFDAIVAAAQSKSALALGPGIGTAPPTRELVVRLAGEIDLPLVADADGLNCLAGQDAHFKTRRAPLVLTPHPGEAARLINLSVAQVQQDRPATARSIAARYNAWTVLKGARTLIADPGGRIWINPTGNAGMAAGGMGDVLTGLIAGLIAQGVPPPAACQAGVYLHGLAADLLAAAAPYGYLATEVAAAVPKAVRHILTQTPTPPLSRRFT
jgi:NAD(P)H-hydrate epimerase